MEVLRRLPFRAPPRRLVPWLAGGAALVVVASVGLVALAVDGGGARPAATRTSRVGRGTVTSTVSAAGNAQPLASRGLNFSMAGTVTELPVAAGDLVAAGAVLARIDPTEAQSAVTQAQTQVGNAQDALTRATSTSSAQSNTTTRTGAACPVAAAGYRLVGAGSPEASRSPSVGPSPSHSRSTPSEQPSSPAGRSPSSRAPGNGQPTGTQGCGGAAGGGTAGGGAGAARAGTTTDSQLSAEQQLNSALLALRQAQARLAGTTITAPVAGKVLSVGGVIGSTAAVSSTGFIVLAGTGDVAVRAQFTEAEVASLAVGQQASITLPNRAGEEFPGRVLQIDPAGTVSSKLVRYAAVITFERIPDGLLYGQTANVAVVTASAENVLTVPATAVTDRNGSTGTVTVRFQNRNQRRTVQIGLRGDVSTEIRSGLAEGEEVLTAGR